MIVLLGLLVLLYGQHSMLAGFDCSGPHAAARCAAPAASLYVAGAPALQATRFGFVLTSQGSGLVVTRIDTRGQDVDAEIIRRAVLELP